MEEDLFDSEECTTCGAQIINGERVGPCLADDLNECPYQDTDFKLNPFEELNFNE